MPRARSSEARNPMPSHGPDIRGNLSFRAGHAARRSEQSVTARRGSFSGARETSSGSETRRRGTKREVAELRQGKLAVARRRNQTSGRPGLQRTTADACDPRGQTLKRQPLSRGHDQPGPHSALAQGALLFGEQLGGRHHAEGTAMQQILLDLVSGAPHRDGEAQRQPTQGEQRDSSAALLQKAHAGKSAAQRQASRLRQAASVCNGVHEPVVKPVLLQREQKRYSGKDATHFRSGRFTVRSCQRSDSVFGDRRWVRCTCCRCGRPRLFRLPRISQSQLQQCAWQDSSRKTTIQLRKQLANRGSGEDTEHSCPTSYRIPHLHLPPK